jgi:hypothetical protein
MPSWHSALSVKHRGSIAFLALTMLLVSQAIDRIIVKSHLKTMETSIRIVNVPAEI